MNDNQMGEPVAWQWLTTAHFRKKLPKDAEKGAWNPLYAAPYSWQQQSTWVKPHEWRGLTDEEMQQVFVANSVMVDNGNAYMVAGLRAINIGQAIEAKLKEKNT